MIDFPPFGRTFDNPHVVALQPDGKILVAGTTSNTDGAVPGQRAAIGRLNPDGTLDASFGSGGRVTIVFGSCGAGCYASSTPTSIAIQPDGKILVGGWYQGYTAPSRPNLAVARLQPDGTLDTAFGTSGVVMVSNSPTSTDLGGITLQPDGRILLVGRTQEPLPGEPPFTNARIALFRLDAQGALDPSFGTGGKVSYSIAPGPNYPGGTKVLADGRIIVVAQVGPFEDLNVAVARFSSAGALEATSVIDVTGDRDFLGAVTFQADGKILFATSGGLGKPALTRVMTDGSRDPTFGTNGVIRLAQGDSVHALQVLPDGRILALNLWPQLLRFMPDGSVDASLGIAGVMFVEGPGGFATALQLDGRLLLAREMFGVGLNGDMGVLRIEPDAPAPMEPSVVAVDFGAQSMGMTSAPVPITLTNTSGTTLTVTTANSASVIFPATHDCGQLAAGASCTLQASFRPRIPGPYSSSIYVSTPAGIIAIPASGIGESSLVTHFYRTILRRAPDVDGKAFWNAEATRLSSAGVNPNEVWFAMSGTFFSSPEYIGLARDNAGFVTDLYRTFFDRSPDSGGLAYWTGLLGTTLPRSAVLSSFQLSPEFRSLTEATFGRPAVRAEMDLVMDFYRGILGRIPDETGLGYWVFHLRNAQCEGADAVRDRADTISRLFLESPEYAGRARGNADYVADLYNAFMRRGPDAGGMAHWMAQLDAGTSREVLRQRFVSSPEFSGRVAAVVQQGCQP